MEALFIIGTTALIKLPHPQEHGNALHAERRTHNPGAHVRTVAGKSHNMRNRRQLVLVRFGRRYGDRLAGNRRKRYWFTDKGNMATGWQEIDGKWYWFASDGAMVTGQQEIDGKQEMFAENGEWLNTVEPAEQAAETATQTGGSAGAWSENGGVWYYTEGGSLATGWKQIDNAWYFFEEDGSMATGWKKADDVWYYLNGNGTMATGWI